LTGIQKDEPVKVDLLTRVEMGNFLEKRLGIEYPDESLKNRGQCYAEIGLLPQGYDMEKGFLELVKEQVGALYDARTKTLIGISDLPPGQKSSILNKMILSHELTHALQDRVINIEKQSEIGLRNNDYEYALRAVVEGMASIVMLAYAQNLPFNKLPDLQSFWRGQLSKVDGGALGHSPQYVKEYLMSPYTEGGAFIQSWQKANPGKTCAELLKKMPISSEQVLHFDKYSAKDEPTRIDLSGIRGKVPEDWKLFYANSLGEFEWLQLFRIHPETKANAEKLAAGWDGCRFEAFRDKKGGMILTGLSIWDSEDDAKEFVEGFTTVLKKVCVDTDYEVTQNKLRVSFVIGSTDRKSRLTILQSLSATE
jgi:hypothetical protein